MNNKLLEAIILQAEQQTTGPQILDKIDAIMTRIRQKQKDQQAKLHPITSDDLAYIVRHEGIFILIVDERDDAVQTGR